MGHAIQHHPSAVIVDQTQFALAQAANSVSGSLQQPEASQVRYQAFALCVVRLLDVWPDVPLNNVLGCYALAVDHAIQHQPSAVVVD